MLIVDGEDPASCSRAFLSFICVNKSLELATGGFLLASIPLNPDTPPAPNRGEPLGDKLDGFCADNAGRTLEPNRGGGVDGGLGAPENPIVHFVYEQWIQLVSCMR